MVEFNEKLKNIPWSNQRQDSLEDQLKDLIVLANRFGMYDAADHIRYNILKENRFSN